MSSLQLICFKVANHKDTIIKILEKNVESQFDNDDLMEDEEDEFLKIPTAAAKKMYAQKKIRLNKLIEIMEIICKTIKVKLVTYEQFLN